jgi:4-hydroxy-3-polyprenylbenzoate decarboxylase
MNLVVAITGASGAAYAVRLLDELLAAGRDVDLTISPAGQTVLRTELRRDVSLEDFRQKDLLATERAKSPPSGKLRYFHHQDLMAPIASGSYLTAGMVICPCSGGTLAAIAHAMGTNLIHRAAEVHLKERRKLILVPRETPLSLPQLDNMKRASEAGAVILPASPGFYHGAKSLDDLVDFVVARICDQLGVEHNLIRRWGEPPSLGE